MGFYIELTPLGRTPEEFAERSIPVVFWILYLIAGFALTCMIWAAFGLLGDLLHTGNWFDRALLGLLGFFVVGYLVAGVKLAWVRKFVALQPEALVVGSRFAGKSFFASKIPWGEILRVELFNHRPTPNRAAIQHDDPQYQIRGHWRAIVTLRDGRSVILDRHVEREALEPLRASVAARLAI